MYRWLFLFLMGFVLYKLFTGDRGRKREQEVQAKERMVATGEMVKDPSCGTYVPADGNIRVRNGDKVYVFCSYACRDAYIKSLEATRTESVDGATQEAPETVNRS